MNLYNLHTNPEQLEGYENSLRIPSYAWAYGMEHGFTEEIKRALAKSTHTAYMYARYVINDRWYPVEDIFISDNADPWYTYQYVRSFFKEGEWPEAEDVIARDADAAYSFAEHLVGGRWEDGEEAIATNPELAFMYAKNIIGKKFHEGEPSIATDPKLAYLYAKDIIKGRFPKGESAIAKEPYWAYYYAIDVIKGRWPEGETAIKTDPEWVAWYEKKFGIKL